jgi:TolB-like protein
MFRSRNVFAIFMALALMVYAVSPVEADKNALAILNLRPTNMEAMGYDGEILYALISALEKQKTIEVMPRREMEEQLFQAGLVQGDTPEMAMAAGQALGINFILFGSVTKKAERIESNVSLMDVEQKRVIQSWRETFSGREEILTRVPEFAEELSSTILNRDQRAVSAAPEIQPDVSIEDLRAKSKGKAVVLTWKFDPAKPITGFHVYRSENPQGPFQFSGKTDRNSFEDSNIKKGRPYYYRIGILHTSGREIKSPHTAEITKAGEKTPHPPLLMGAKAFIKRIEINFVPSLLNDQEKFKIKQYKIHKKNLKSNNTKSTKKPRMEIPGKTSRPSVPK